MTVEIKIKSILTYLVPSIISNMLPIISLPIITRYLSPRDYGIVALATSTMAIVVTFFVFNVDYATQRYYFEHREDKIKINNLLTTTFIYMVGIMICLLPIVLLLSKYISSLVMGSGGYYAVIVAAYISSCFSTLLSFMLILYRLMERSSEYSVLTTINVIASFVLTMFMIAFLKMGYMGLVIASMVSQGAVFLITFVRFAKEFSGRFDKKMLVDNLIFGIPLTPNILTSSVYQFFDKYMLGNLISLSAVGFFSIAQNISSKMFAFMTAVQATFEPIFMKDIFSKDYDSNKRVGRNFTVFTYISLSLVVFMLLFGEEVIYILAPKSYYSAIDALLILIGMVSIQTFGKIVGSQLAYAKKAYLSFPITVVGMFVNVLLNLLFIPKWGAAGAAFATLCTTGVMNIIFVYISQKCYEIVYDKKNLLFMYGNLFVALVVILFLRSIDASIFIKYPFKIMFLSLYVYSGITTNILTKQKICAIISMLNIKRPEQKALEA